MDDVWEGTSLLDVQQSSSKNRSVERRWGCGGFLAVVQRSGRKDSVWTGLEVCGGICQATSVTPA